MRHSTRLAGCLLAVVAASPGLVGMGGFGGGREEGLPARDFSATFTDVDGTRMTVTRVTSGGDASLEGDLGRGRLRVPFDNIARVTFQPAENDHERVPRWTSSPVACCCSRTTWSRAGGTGCRRRAIPWGRA